MSSDTPTAEDLFQCQQCGQCCQGFGGTYVSRSDIRNIAAYTGKSEADIRQSYCAGSGSKLVLGQQPDGYCVFWDQLCTIHPVKPRMCKAWPFIESVVYDPGNWDIMAGVCPGIRTGFAHSGIIQCVKEKLAELASAYPESGRL